MIKKLAMFGLMATLFSGCELFYPSIHYVESDNPTAVVLVGVRENYLGWDTATYYGAQVDMDKMYEIATNLTDDVVYIMDMYVYRKNVKEAFRRALQKELCIFYFTGRGGSDWAIKDRKNEADYKTDYLIFGDSTLTDNEIWEMMQESKGRVVLIFDCDMSGTMYRTSPEQAKRDDEFFSLLGKKVQDNPNLRMICWSRCAETVWSPSTPNNTTGSPFTSAIYQTCKYLDSGITYKEAFERMQTYLKGYSKRYNTPIKTVIGESFEDKPVFR